MAAQEIELGKNAIQAIKIIWRSVVMPFLEQGQLSRKPL
jgi:hypothetical protein